MTRYLLLVLAALVAPGCMCEPSRKGAEVLCRSFVAGAHADIARRRALSDGLTVHDFPDGRGFLASERALLPSDAMSCQVNSRDGRITSLHLFAD